MTPTPRRAVRPIDAEVHALRQVTRAAMAELEEVRRRQSELLDMEAALLVAIDVRNRRMDALLDARLRVAVPDGAPCAGGVLPGGVA